MYEFLDSRIFCVTITLFGYMLGIFMKNRYQKAIFNPILVAMLFSIGALSLLGLDYQTYAKHAEVLSYLLAPATVCLAIPLYRQFHTLKKHFKAITGGIMAGVCINIIGIFILVRIFQWDKTAFVSYLAKSVTMALAIGITEQMYGIVAVTITAVMVTGLVGNILADPLIKLIKLKNPIAKGIAIGVASHIIGTTKAVEMGETEGAMSSLAIIMTGVITIFISVLLATFLC